MQLMTSEEAWRMSTARNSSPVDVAFCEDLVQELSQYVSKISSEVRKTQDVRVVSSHYINLQNPSEASAAKLKVS